MDNYNVITLAYMGDAIYEVYIRKYLINSGIVKVKELNSKAINYVSAKGQCKALMYLLDNNILTKEEIEIVKRGRNYNRSVHPSGTDIITYKRSTGFEAMLGHLYLSDNIIRLEEVIKEVINASIWTECR